MANYKPNRKRIAILTAVAALLFMAAVAAYFVTSHSDATSLPFSTERWIAPDTDSQRKQMLESLLSEHHLVGMTKEEVVALLGPPDRENRFGHGDLNYVLGPEEGFISIDMDWLT